MFDIALSDTTTTKIFYWKNVYITTSMNDITTIKLYNLNITTNNNNSFFSNFQSLLQVNMQTYIHTLTQKQSYGSGCEKIQ